MLRSSDLERACSFYRAVGLEFTRHSHGKGPEHETAEAGGVVLGIYPLTASSSPTTGTRVGFRVRDVDQLVGWLLRMGVEVVTPPADSEWGRRAVVRDFDGHVVELVTSHETRRRSWSL